MDKSICDLILIFLAALILAKPAKADHEGAVLRPEVEATKPAGCGSEIKQITLQHRGYGAFSWKTYDVKIFFDSNGNGMSIETDYGENRTVSFRIGKEKGYELKHTVNFFQTDVENGRLEDWQSVRASREAEEMLRRVEARNKQLSSFQREAIRCAREKIGQFEKDSLAARLAGYAKNRQRSPSSNSEESKSGIGIGSNGAGFQSGGFSINFNGEVGMGY